jgi:hypothetical protein
MAAKVSIPHKRLAVIEALVKPETFPRLHAQFKGHRVALIQLLAHQNGIAARTVYHYLARYKRGGIDALRDSARSDRGRPRRLNAAAAQFLLTLALPRTGGYCEPSVADIFRAYENEAAWRLAHKGQKLTPEFEAHKYRAWMDAEGRLKAEAYLPKVGYSTLRFWLKRLYVLDLMEVYRKPKTAKKGGRKGNG